MDSASKISRLERMARRPLNAWTIRTARAFLIDCPEAARAWHVLGRALLDGNRYDEAEAAFTRALELTLPDKRSHL